MLGEGRIFLDERTQFPEPSLSDILRGWWQKELSKRQPISLIVNLFICRNCEWQAVDWGSLVENPNGRPIRGVIS